MQHASKIPGARLVDFLQASRAWRSIAVQRQESRDNDGWAQGITGIPGSE